MEFYGTEGKKLRKKDFETGDVYYYSPDEEYVKVPGLFSSEAAVKAFALRCVLVSFPEVTERDVDDVWSELMKRNVMIIKALEDLKRENELSGDSSAIWKTKAYTSAINALKKLKIPIVSGDQVIKIKGIGKGIAAHIDEIISTGGLKSQDERAEESITRATTLEKFLAIWGVGPKHANAWYAKGHRDIEDLAGEKLTEQQKVGLRYYDDLKQRIPREEATRFYELISSSIHSIYPRAKVEIVGSYRREADTVGDIDIIFSIGDDSTPEVALRLVIDQLMESGVVTDDPVCKEKFMGVGIVPSDSESTHRRIDIRVVPADEWGSSLLHHTGSDVFNKNMRLQASQMGYRLSEKGLVKLSVKDDGDELVPTRTERDVFNILGLPWVEPRDRN